ncbi:pancreatic triacylglycerol lipase-like [Plodia interpunctella]|uniref:pancreatic triacylglycerol lipase-like n=1 Tax=Plodia interpunctella TaxID=58824 RepID=UPI002367E535|nr:pancreatic triacylglycerol lipase-like [Plodia interpunctella]
MLNSISILFGISLVLATTTGDQVSEDLPNGQVHRYFLYNRKIYGEEISYDPQDSGNSGLIEDLPTVIIIHGHRDSYNGSFTQYLTNELVANENINVIALDWSEIASMPYSFAQNSVLRIGDYLAAFIANHGINLATTHLIGLDLGAHIAGVSGRRHFGRIARITGLSPTTNVVKLTSTDARYVEVIHTGAACRHGLTDKLGHADFYPNGGGFQPGCWTCDCHRNRSWLYFLVSIKTTMFNANCCNSMLEKDEDICRGTFLPLGTTRLAKTPCVSGIYRINTREDFPF